jgi:S-adenosylhomocysteine hydrolase
MATTTDRFQWTRYNMPFIYTISDEILASSDLKVLIGLPLTWETLCLIDAIRHKTPNITVIPQSSGKNSSLEPGVFAYLDKWGVNYIKTATEESRIEALKQQPDIIVDCAFALVGAAIQNGLLDSKTIIVEQTKTGENALESHNLKNPIVILDNSSFKREYENKEAVGYSVIVALKSMGMYLPRYTVGIIGYGYVGMGLAKYAKSSGAEVLVCEPSPTKQSEASKLYSVVDKDELLRKADIVITATGRRDIIAKADITGLNKTLMIANAGGEDEWNRQEMFEGQEPVKIHEYITQYKVGSCTLWEVCGGNSVNLVTEVSLSEFLDITFSHLISVLAQLEKLELAAGKNELDLFDTVALESRIKATGWLEDIDAGSLQQAKGKILNV